MFTDPPGLVGAAGDGAKPAESGGLLLLIVLAEPWLLALAVQVGVLLGGFYLLVRFVKAAWQD